MGVVGGDGGGKCLSLFIFLCMFMMEKKGRR